MAITLVGESNGTNAAVGTTQAVTRTTAAGSALVVAVHLATGSSVTVSTVTDTAGNTWAKAVSAFQTGVNSRVELWYVTNAAAVTSVTVTVSGSTRMRVSLSEWAGVATIAALDATAGAGAAATTTPAAVTVTTTNAGDVIVGGITYASTTAPTLASPFTALSGGVTGTVYGADAYRIPGLVGSYGPSWTIPSSGSGAATIALLSAGGPPIADNFSTAFDYTRWPGSYGNPTNVSGRCRVPCTSSYPSAITDNVFDLTQYPITIQVPTLPVEGAGGTQVQFNLPTGSNNVQFQIQGQPRILQFLATGLATTSVPYDAVAHQWLQFSTSNGNLIWSTSPDGTTWTVRRTVAAPAYVATGTLFKAALSVGYFGTETAPGYAEFDNFNLPPASAPTSGAATAAGTVSVAGTAVARASIAAAGVLAIAAAALAGGGAAGQGAATVTGASTATAAATAGGALAVTGTVSATGQATTSGLVTISGTAAPSTGSTATTAGAIGVTGTAGARAAASSAGAITVTAASTGRAATTAAGTVSVTSTAVASSGATSTAAGTVTVVGTTTARGGATTAGQFQIAGSTLPGAAGVATGSLDVTATTEATAAAAASGAVEVTGAATGHIGGPLRDINVTLAAVTGTGWAITAVSSGWSVASVTGSEWAVTSATT